MRGDPESVELLLEFAPPESADFSGADDHEDLPRLRQEMKHVIEEPGKVGDGRDGGVVLARRRVAHVQPIDDGQQLRHVGEELPPVLRANIAAGPPMATMRSGFGRSAKVDRMKATIASRGAPMKPVGPTTT